MGMELNIKEERHYGFCGLMIKSTRRKSVDKTFSIRGAFSEQKESSTSSWAGCIRKAPGV